MLPFHLPPPNDDAYYLEQLIDPNTKRRWWVGEKVAQEVIPWVHDLENFITMDEQIARQLTTLHNNNWNHIYRRRLRQLLREKFLSCQKYQEEKFLEEFDEFWCEQPSYHGCFHGFLANQVGWRELEINGEKWDQAYPMYTQEQYSENKKRLAAEVARYDFCSNLISEWAMQSFDEGRRTGNLWTPDWPYVDVQPLVFEPEPEEETNASLNRSRCSSKNNNSGMSAAERATQRLLNKLKRKGLYRESVDRLIEGN